MLGDGGRHCERVRVLIDPCSESTLITLRLARRFGRNRERRNVRIAGVVGEATGTTLLRAQIRIYPPDSTTPLYGPMVSNVLESLLPAPVLIAN